MAKSLPILHKLPSIYLTYSFHTEPASQPVNGVLQTEHRNGIKSLQTELTKMCGKQWETIDKWILIQNAFTETQKCYHCVNLF